MIFQNPFWDSVQEFERLYKEYNVFFFFITKFLKKSKKNNLEENRVSKFYQNEEIPSIKTLVEHLSDPLNTDFKMPSGPNVSFPKENFLKLLAEIFYRNDSKIPHVERLLCWYPELLQINFETKQCIMRDSGPLPLDWRYFIAIMVKHIFSNLYDLIGDILLWFKILLL